MTLKKFKAFFDGDAEAPHTFSVTYSTCGTREYSVRVETSFTTPLHTNPL